MSHQFNPGDLAMLVSSEAPHLVGSVVQLVEYVGRGVVVEREGRTLQNLWGRRIWWVSLCSGQTYTNGNGFQVGEGFCDENRLMPLRGDFAPTEQKSQAVPV